MLNYVTNMRAAAKDAAARYGMTAGAAVIFLIAVAFLIAALWVFTARHWGSLVTNLAFAGGFAVLGAIILAVARSYRVAAPSVEDLRDEVEAKLVDKASALVDQAELRVNRFVARTEHRVSHLARSAGDQMSQAAGFTPELLDTVRTNSFRAGIVPPLMGAFLLGLNFAVRARRRR